MQQLLLLLLLLLLWLRLLPVVAVAVVVAVDSDQILQQLLCATLAAVAIVSNSILDDSLVSKQCVCV